LVLSDVHLGDAIVLQGSVAALRELFPKAQIDYAVKRSMEKILEGNPLFSNVIPLFTESPLPGKKDLESAKKLLAEGGYDICFNFCPFFQDGEFFPQDEKVLHFVTHGPHLVFNQWAKKEPNHFHFQAYEFIHQLLARFRSPDRPQSYRGPSIVLSDEAVEEAENFLEANHLKGPEPLLFLNPDTASPYTRVPSHYLAELLWGLSSLPGKVLLGASFSEPGAEQRLLNCLPSSFRTWVTVVPTSLSLPAYAALTDRADLFLSGDTGPLHVAAARKISKSGRHSFRNKTSVFCLFGATLAGFSGYASEDTLFCPAAQDAPSRVYVSESPCRNLTCLNKMYKTCKELRCFEFLDVEKILEDAGRFVETVHS
ncbi:MAG TPA: glycosyltransferase family 9 protein, partial [bacterium]